MDKAGNDLAATRPGGRSYPEITADDGTNIVAGALFVAASAPNLPHAAQGPRIARSGG